MHAEVEALIIQGSDCIPSHLIGQLTNCFPHQVIGFRHFATGKVAGHTHRSLGIEIEHNAASMSPVIAHQCGHALRR
jgi:hypothetical protein